MEKGMGDSGGGGWLGLHRLTRNPLIGGGMMICFLGEGIREEGKEGLSEGGDLSIDHCWFKREGSWGGR